MTRRPIRSSGGWRAGRLYASALLLAGLLVWTLPAASDTTSEEPPTPAAPSETSDRAPEADGAAAIEAIYKKKCALCHGLDGTAKRVARDAPDFHDPEWQRTTAHRVIVEAITGGKGKMRGYASEIGEADIDALARYLKTLKPAAGN